MKQKLSDALWIGLGIAVAQIVARMIGVIK